MLFYFITPQSSGDLWKLSPDPLGVPDQVEYHRSMVVLISTDVIYFWQQAECWCHCFQLLEQVRRPCLNSIKYNFIVIDTVWHISYLSDRQHSNECNV